MNFAGNCAFCGSRVEGNIANVKEAAAAKTPAAKSERREKIEVVLYTGIKS